MDYKYAMETQFIALTPYENFDGLMMLVAAVAVHHLVLVSSRQDDLNW
jgi:hypothetical protein